MADISLEWQGDFQVASNGDLLISDGDNEVRQRLERRLFTAVQGYIWHAGYGAGLPQKIGDPYTLYTIQSIVNSQLALEASVAKNPSAIIQVAQDQNNLSAIIISIKYWDAATGTTVSFQITT